MNWQSLSHDDDSAARSVEQLSFDILRVLVANRQATSPTVRALAGQTIENGSGADPAAARLRLLAGHRTDEAAGAAGAFFLPRPGEAAVSAGNGDHPVAARGERHA